MRTIGLFLAFSFLAVLALYFVMIAFASDPLIIGSGASLAAYLSVLAGFAAFSVARAI